MSSTVYNMLFALVDCNNFYVSCERVFNPSLENKPVVVLSNNDGCIISRSNEAKKLNIPMGAPYFKWKAFCEQHAIAVFSSNYELYGDLSQRVMTLLNEFTNQCEIYSIDEAFLKLPESISFAELSSLRNRIKMCTGIPISIGVGKTKTLAKIANHLAKMSTLEGVYFLTDKLQCLAHFPVGKIWGVGARLSQRLKHLNIETAQQLQEANAKWIRLHFNVNVEKIVQELNGTSCLDLEKVQARKQIISSRSFGKKLTTLAELEEAISHYVHIATKKLRKQHGVCAGIYVFLQTSPFQQNESYANGLTFSFPTPNSDTRYIIRIAKQCLARLYKKNYRYHKAGVMLLGISKAANTQLDLLNPVLNEKGESVMKTMDHLNEKMGKNTLFIAAEGIKRHWTMNANQRSPRYTTRWNELPIAFCK